MQREKACGDPGPGQPQETEDPSQQNGVAAMQQHIDGVIPGGVQSPEVIFDPKDGKGERIMLLGGAGRKPNAMQPGKASELCVMADVGVVVPEKIAAHGRHIDGNGGD